MESLYRRAKDEAEKMQRTVQRLANDIEARKHKILALDKTVFSIELDCKRTGQQIQELTIQKDRLERLIANVLNGEDYSKLKEIAKENVKAVLSEKRVLISISFAAVIQTLKADPQLVKLLYNTPSADDDEQRKDNDININKYLELNKDLILNLGQKNYENLVEKLTINAINTVADSSSNFISSSSQSSSTFPNLSNQSDKYRIEEPESYHNSKGDIAD